MEARQDVHSEVKEFVVRPRLPIGSKQMSKDGEYLHIRMRETQLQRLLTENSRSHEEMVKSTCVPTSYSFGTTELDIPLTQKAGRTTID